MAALEGTRRNVLITGLPRVGKTTLISRLAEELRDSRPEGFYTQELRHKNIRQGFQLIGLDGRKGLLAHVDIKSPFRVGKYGVDVEGFDRFLEETGFFRSTPGVVIVDEIGKMECFSRRFQKGIRRLLQSPGTLIATVAFRGGGFILEVKQRKDVLVYELSLKNRSFALGQILGILKDQT